MGHLIIDAPNQGVDPRLAQRFPNLRSIGGAGMGNIGGKWCPPPEFDTVRYASAFHAEGNEVLAAQVDQPIPGTNLVSEGWKVWRYPDKSAIQKRDDKGEPVFRKGKDGQPDEPVYEDHPQKGQPYKVPPIDRDGQTYILMFRPIEVQEQVNEVCGLVSIEQMTAEIRGETIAGNAPQDPGMLGENALMRINSIDRDIEADRAAEANLGRSTVVHSSLQTTSGRISRQPMRVSR